MRYISLFKHGQPSPLPPAPFLHTGDFSFDSTPVQHFIYRILPEGLEPNFMLLKNTGPNSELQPASI